MDAPSDAIVGVTAAESPFDLQLLFEEHYARIARVIARVIRDRARAEELAVEVFLKISKHPLAQGEQAGGWLYRTAVRIALDELRRQARRSRYERLAGWMGAASPIPTPEDVRAVREDQAQVRAVLSAISKRQAALLILRSEGLSYDEIASTLELHPGSVGTLLGRAQQAFRKEYVRRYGTS